MNVNSFGKKIVVWEVCMPIVLGGQAVYEWNHYKMLFRKSLVHSLHLVAK